MRLLSVALVALLLAGCVSQQAWSPVVDPYGDPRAEWIPHDDYECRELARRASGFGPDEVIRGGLIGGLFGAATGAAIGAATGNPGQGAAIGAATGGFGGGAMGGLSSDAHFQYTFRRCMQGRGHNVIG